MVQFLGLNIPAHRTVKKALQVFFGIGNQTAQRLMARHHIHQTAKLGELGDEKLLELTGSLDSMTIDNDLRRKVLDDIQRLRDTGTYRGRRHAMNLPVRGQGTRNQIKTSTRLNRVDRRL